MRQSGRAFDAVLNRWLSDADLPAARPPEPRSVATTSDPQPIQPGAPGDASIEAVAVCKDQLVPSKAAGGHGGSHATQKMVSICSKIAGCTVQARKEL